MQTPLVPPRRSEVCWRGVESWKASPPHSQFDGEWQESQMDQVPRFNRIPFPRHLQAADWQASQKDHAEVAHSSN